MSIFTKILGDPNEREVKKLRDLVAQINALESEIAQLSDVQIKKKSNELRSMWELRSPTLDYVGDRNSHIEGLDKLFPQAFAMVREVAKRTLGQRHFDAQLMGGIVLHQGKIAEMRTGEGKTLAATAPVYLNALTGRGVHVVTVNDYLAKRDAVWMGQIYHALGMSVACITHESAFLYDPAYRIEDKPKDENEENFERDKTRDELGGFQIEESYLRPCSRKEAYAADITYGTNNEYGFDYLRDNMAYEIGKMAQRSPAPNGAGREPYFAIVDEVDSILIDEARTPLIISAPDTESTSLYQTFSRVVPQLKENEDYNLDEKMRTATITEEGVRKLEKVLGIENIYDPAKGGGIRYVHQVEQALKARVLFQKDKDYVVKDGEVVIVDEFTGRLMPGRRYSEGLHQALEAKEGLTVQKESRTLATITFQNYFRMYKKLAGMTGTAMTSAEELDRVYKLQVVSMPTNKPMARNDKPDLVFRTSKGKMQAIVNEVKRRNEAGQPVLIGTTSIQNNEVVSIFLQKGGIKHEVLNAKNHEREGAIIAQAGKPGAVTVATNMAGRGVDIILGGNPPTAEDAEKVRQAGGLFVMGTERHEARRIDNQLRGRSGRQGDPGETQFFVSLEDDLMRIFGGDRIKKMMETLRIPEDQPIQSGLISGSIESAQGKIEGYHFDTRKHVLDYDEVLNKQRQVIYTRRKEILDSAGDYPSAHSRPPAAASEVMAGQSMLGQPSNPSTDNPQPSTLSVSEMIEDELHRMVDFHTQSHPADWNVDEIFENIKSIINVPEDFRQHLGEVIRKSFDKTQDKQAEPEVLREELSNTILGLLKGAYEKKREKVGEEQMKELEKFVMLRTIDILWMDHLETMDSLRDSVKLRAYGQKDPLVEYKREGREMFENLLGEFQRRVVGTIFKVELKQAPQTQQISGQENRGGSDPPVKSHSHSSNSGQQQLGRNDPCHCGSGKKYKKCHGA